MGGWLRDDTRHGSGKSEIEGEGTVAHSQQGRQTSPLRLILPPPRNLAAPFDRWQGKRTKEVVSERQPPSCVCPEKSGRDG